MAQTGEFDQGDLGGLPEFAFECRDRAKLDLAGNVKDANNRAAAKRSKYGVAVMKARGKKTGDGYDCLPRSNVTLKQSVHRHRANHVFRNLVYDPALSSGQVERKSFEKQGHWICVPAGWSVANAGRRSLEFHLPTD